MLTKLTGSFPFYNNSEVHYILKGRPEVDFYCDAEIAIMRFGEAVLTGKVVSLLWIRHNLQREREANQKPSFYGCAPGQVVVDTLHVEQIQHALFELWENKGFFSALEGRGWHE